MPSVGLVSGIILVLLFYSLLATIIMESVSGFLSMRGKHLEKILRGLLSSGDRREEVLNDFKSNSLYKQLSGNVYGKNSPPSYLSSDMFRSILFQIISMQKNGKSFVDKIQQLPDDNLKSSLMQIWDESNQRFDLFSGKVENWYDQVMDRASGWYKRNVQKGLILTGVIIAVVFNVDILSIYNHLAQASQTDLDQLTALAKVISEKEVNRGVYVPDSLSAGQTRFEPADSSTLNDRELYELINTNLEKLQSPLGIGWEGFQPSRDINFWLFKIFGWIVTALCISKGAPFWFDLLKKIVNFRDSGTPPVKTEPEAAAAIAPPASAPMASSQIQPSIDIESKPVG